MKLSLAMKFTFRLSLIILIHLVATSHASHHFTNVDYDNGLLCHTNDSVPIPWDFTTQSQTTIYSIALSSDKVKVGQTVTVLLSSTSNHPPSDFFIKAVSAHNVENNGVLSSSVGEFYFENDQTNYSALYCQSKPLTIPETLTASNIPWKIRMLWSAPSFPGTFVLTTAIRQESSMEWTTIISQLIEVEPLRPVSNAESSTFLPNQITSKCGVDRSCLGVPNNCISANLTENKTCDIFLSFHPDELFINFEMMAPGEGYVAMGVSSDGIMGNDIVIECLINDEGLPKIYASVNSPRANMKVGIDREYLIYNHAHLMDGILYCSFSCPLILNVGPIAANLKNDRYYILLASGPSKNNDITYHSNRMVSVVKVNFTSVDFTIIESSDSPTPYEIVIHGAVMIVAWIGMVGLSIFIARFYKDMWPEKTLCGLKLWFAWHRALNVLAVILTIIAIVRLLLYTGITDIWQAYAHPSFGTVTAILALSQPIGALFRPPPSDPKRLIFNWIHYGIGMLAFMFGVVTMFLAVELKASHLQPFFYWILASFVVFYIVIYGVVEFYVHLVNQGANLKKEVTLDGRVTMQQMQNRNSSKQEGVSFKTLMLFTMTLGIVVFTVALILVIAL